MKKKATNPSHATDKFPHQVNANFTADDMEKINAVNQKFFGGDASGSMLIRALVRKGIEGFMKEDK